MDIYGETTIEETTSARKPLQLHISIFQFLCLLVRVWFLLVNRTDGDKGVNEGAPRKQSEYNFWHLWHIYVQDELVTR